jgi:hypothetical protein
LPALQARPDRSQAVQVLATFKSADPELPELPVLLIGQPELHIAALHQAAFQLGFHDLRGPPPLIFGRREPQCVGDVIVVVEVVHPARGDHERVGRGRAFQVRLGRHVRALGGIDPVLLQRDSGLPPAVLLAGIDPARGGLGRARRNQRDTKNESGDYASFAHIEGSQHGVPAEYHARTAN